MSCCDDYDCCRDDYDFFLALSRQFACFEFGVNPEDTDGRPYIVDIYVPCPASPMLGIRFGVYDDGVHFVEEVIAIRDPDYSMPGPGRDRAAFQAAFLAVEERYGTPGTFFEDRSYVDRRRSVSREEFLLF